MKKYLVQYGRIEAVEVVKETEKTVTVQYLGPRGYERRMLKTQPEAKSLCDTWAAAKAHLVALAETRLSYAREDVERAERALANTQAMQEPAE